MNKERFEIFKEVRKGIVILFQDNDFTPHEGLSLHSTRRLITFAKLISHALIEYIH
jgi:hypothetical protein